MGIASKEVLEYREGTESSYIPGETYRQLEREQRAQQGSTLPVELERRAEQIEQIKSQISTDYSNGITNRETLIRTGRRLWYELNVHCPISNVSEWVDTIIENAAPPEELAPKKPTLSKEQRRVQIARAIVEHKEQLQHDNAKGTLEDLDESAPTLPPSRNPPEDILEPPTNAVVDTEEPPTHDHDQEAKEDREAEKAKRKRERDKRKKELSNTLRQATRKQRIKDNKTQILEKDNYHTVDKRDVYQTPMVTTATIKDALRFGDDNLAFARAYCKLVDVIAARGGFDCPVEIPSRTLKTLLPCLGSNGPNGKKISVNQMFKIVQRHFLPDSEDLRPIGPFRRSCYDKESTKCRSYWLTKEYSRRGSRVESFWDGLVQVSNPEAIRKLKLPRRNRITQIANENLERMKNMKPAHCLTDIPDFVAERCALKPSKSYRTKRGTLWEAYKEWGGRECKTVFLAEIKREFSGKPYPIRGAYYFPGIRLKHR